MIRKILAVVLVFLSAALAARPASAIYSYDVSLSLGPPSQSISLTPGETYTGKVKIINTGEYSFSVGLSVTPYQVDSETYDHDFATNNVYTQLYTWITFPQDVYYLGPGESVDAIFEANVPEGTAGGGQYAAVIASVKDIEDDGGAVQVIPQVASLIYGRIDGPEMKPEGEVVEQSIPGFLLNGPLEISETVYNTGNVDFKIYHLMKVTDFFSGKVLLDPEVEGDNPEGLETGVVLPGTSRRQTVVWENTPRLGIVKVEQKVIFLDEEVINEQVVIFCPLWLILSVIGLIALGALWIYLVIRHRKRKAPQVL